MSCLHNNTTTTGGGYQKPIILAFALFLTIAKFQLGDSPLVMGAFLIATVEGDILIVAGLSVKLGLR